MGGVQPWVQVTCLLMGLAVESPLSSPAGPFLSSRARTGLENGLLASRASVSCKEAIFSLCRGDHWPRTVTIASTLDSGCGLSLECVQDGCNGTCVKCNREPMNCYVSGHNIIV